MPNHAYPNETLGEIDHLSRMGWSNRKIAEQTGVSKSFVQLVTSGKRKERFDTTEEPLKPRRKYPPADGDYERCPDCGAMIQPPCLACELKKDPKDRSEELES